MAASTLIIGRSKTASKKTPTIAGGKAKGKGDGNIMSFFKKADSSTVGSPGGKCEKSEESLFVEERPVKGQSGFTMQTPTPPREEASPKDADVEMLVSPLSRYNEDTIPNKRRRTEEAAQSVASPNHKTPREPVCKGPFVDDSDSDDDKAKPPAIVYIEDRHSGEASWAAMSSNRPCSETIPSEVDPVDPPPPPLKRESTSMGELDGFEGIDDFIDDEFPEEGEEFLERRWMEEQAELEMGLEAEDEEQGDATDGVQQNRLGHAASVVPEDAGSATCPICGGYTTGMTEQVSVKHDVLFDSTRLTFHSKYLCMSMTAWMGRLSRFPHTLPQLNRNRPMDLSRPTAMFQDISASNVLPLRDQDKTTRLFCHRLLQLPLRHSLSSCLDTLKTLHGPLPPLQNRHRAVKLRTNGHARSIRLCQASLSVSMRFVMALSQGAMPTFLVTFTATTILALHRLGVTVRYIAAMSLPIWSEDS